MVSFTKSASYSSDKSCSFPAAILGEKEGDVALGSEFFHCLNHDSGETGRRKYIGKKWESTGSLSYASPQNCPDRYFF